MVWICAGNTIDNSGIFLLLLNSTSTEWRFFLLLTPLHQQGVWGWTRIWKWTQVGQLTPSDQRDTPDCMASSSAYKSGEEGREDVQSNVVFVLKTPLNGMEPCFLGDGWIPASLLEAVNAHLGFLCLYAQSLLYLLNYLTFTLSVPSPIPPGGSQ